MRNVVLARIDDRLIHGQVVTAWLKKTDGNLIVIPDDGVAKDVFMQRVLKAAAPKGVDLRVMTVADGAKFLLEESAPNEKVVILAKYPATYVSLIEAGCKFDEIVLGGMVNNPKRKPFIKQCACTDEEAADMEKIVDAGIHLYFQLVPGQTVIECAGPIKTRLGK
ncbi:MAG: PTS sugar transporter subunit IIB [Erysipelotrichaceae bacterium]|nr:PTS sugar transporter subunit IIB [Erysipelotrichaceae bacterium]